jgi:O-antigen ligase
MYKFLAQNEKGIFISAAILLIFFTLGIVFYTGEKSAIFLALLIIITLILGLILLNPYLGILAIVFLIPFENLQVLPGVGLTVTKIVGIVTFFSLMLNIISGKIKGIKKSPVDVPLFCFLGICLSSLVKAEDINISFTKLKSLFSYVLLFYMTGTVLHTKRRVVTALFVLIFSISVVSFIMILQVYGIDLGIGSLETITTWVGSQATIRYSGTFHDPNRFSTLQIIGSAVILGLFGIMTFRKKFLLVIAFAAMMGSIYYSYSRSAYLAVIALSTIYSIIQLRRHFLVTIFIAATLVVLVFTFIPENVYEHFQKGVTLEDSSTRERFQQYQAAWKHYSQNWFLGVGIGNQRDIMIGTQVGFDVLTTGLHCLPYSILLETGILGFAVYCWMMVNCFLVLYQSMEKSHDSDLRYIFLSGILIMVGYYTQNIFHNFMDLSILGLMPGIMNAALWIFRKQAEIPVPVQNASEI